MTDSDLIIYLSETEKKYKAMAQKYRAAVQLIGRMLDPEMAEDAQDYSDQVKTWLNTQEIEYNTHAGWCVGTLCQEPDPETITGWHREMIEAARAYYQKLDSGEDPGPAKEYLDGLCAALRDPDAVAMKMDYLSKFIPTLEMERLVRMHEKKGDR